MPRPRIDFSANYPLTRATNARLMLPSEKIADRNHAEVKRQAGGLLPEAYGVV